MKTINKNETNKHAIRYTVQTRTLEDGKITLIDSVALEVGDKKNVSFVDEFGNKMIRYEVIEKIVKTEIFDHGYEECEII